MKKFIVVLCCISVIFVNCIETVTINSNPGGAKCYIQNKYCGETPVTTGVDSWALGGNPTIRLEKDGYYPYTGILRKKAQGGYIALGILFFPPMLFFTSALVSGDYFFNLSPITN